jgi:glycosyltransferase involved in cell wall biosynthesis
LADHIVVNSEWSKRGLIEENIPAEKIFVVPLAYEPPAEAKGFTRSYPKEFTSERPLRVLFLGQVNLRKGAAPLLEAIRTLKEEPIAFWFVGPIQIEIPEDLASSRTVRWIGPVPRSEVSHYYREADVFIFPSFSDGFGLTQLEAQAWRLPLIASRNCGDVVQDDQNGWLLNKVTGQSIAEIVRQLLPSPGKLAKTAAAGGISTEFRLNAIGKRLVEIAGAPSRR